MSETVPTATDGELALDGVTISYTSYGEGPLVLNAHGLSSSRRADAAMGLTDFTPVAAHHRLISYDARGHGASTGSRESADYSWAALAGDLVRIAEHLAPSETFSVIGSSMGTGTALHAVVAQPERFDRLVLTAPPTSWETRAGQSGIYRQMADAIETSTPEQLAAMFGQAPIPPVFADVPGYPGTPDVAFDLMPTIFRGAALSDFPAPELIATIAKPTLILAWATDPGHPISSAERLAELIPGSILHVSETSADIHTWGDRAAEFLG